MMRRGFTVVELLITITIMGILLTLAVVNLNSSQVNARDAERKTDAENIALALESFYRNQSPDLFMSGGTYLGWSYINDSEIPEYLQDIDPKSLRAPGVDVSAPMSLKYTTSTSENPASISPKPSKTNDIYVYQAFTNDGYACPDPFLAACQRFNLYYYQESDDSIQVIVSKNQ